MREVVRKKDEKRGILFYVTDINTMYCYQVKYEDEVRWEKLEDIKLDTKNLKIGRQ